MEINISVRAYYTNGHSASFKKEVEVTDEELELIKACAAKNEGKLDELKETAPDLFDTIYFPCLHKGRREGTSRGSYRPIRILGCDSTIYRRTNAALGKIVMSYETE